MSLQYLDENGDPNPSRNFQRWEDWVRYHDRKDCEEHEELVRTTGKCVLEEIKKAVAPLLQSIAELEAGGIRYQGVFQKAIAYRKGDVTTFDGSMWICVADVVAQGGEAPGKSSSWQLCV